MRTVDNQVLTALHQIRDAIKNKECCCNKDEQGGGLTGNILDDWVNAVTQGEYTKYEDIPLVDKEGEILFGWRRLSDSYTLAPLPPSSARSSFISRDIKGEIVKDGAFTYSGTPR